LAVDSDQIGQIELAGQRKSFLADLLLADEQLDSARPVLDVHKPQLARIPLQDDATRRADVRPRQFARPLLLHPRAKIYRLGTVQRGQLDLFPAFFSQLDLSRAGSDVADIGSVVKPSPPGVDSHLCQLAQFIAPGRFMNSRRLSIRLPRFFF